MSRKELVDYLNQAIKNSHNTCLRFKESGEYSIVSCVEDSLIEENSVINKKEKYYEWLMYTLERKGIPTEKVSFNNLRNSFSIWEDHNTSYFDRDEVIAGLSAEERIIKAEVNEKIKFTEKESWMLDVKFENGRGGDDKHYSWTAHSHGESWLAEYPLVGDYVKQFKTLKGAKRNFIKNYLKSTK